MASDPLRGGWREKRRKSEIELPTLSLFRFTGHTASSLPHRSPRYHCELPHCPSLLNQSLVGDQSAKIVLDLHIQVQHTQESDFSRVSLALKQPNKLFLLLSAALVHSCQLQQYQSVGTASIKKKWSLELWKQVVINTVSVLRASRRLPCPLSCHWSLSCTMGLL